MVWLLNDTIRPSNRQTIVFIMEKDLEKEYERIGRFFAFEMDEAERIAFEQEAEKNDELTEQIKRFRAVENVVEKEFGGLEATEKNINP